MKYKVEYSHSIKDFEDVWNIEKEYLEPSTISSVEQVLNWDAKNTDIHIFVRDIIADKIVGEITILPLSKEQFNKFMNNELEDTQINNDSLLKYNENEKYYLLFSAIAIDKNYREDRLVLGLLLKGFYEKLCFFELKNISFFNMCAEGQTKDGQKFIESFLNLKCKNNTDEGYKLYCFDGESDFDIWLKKFPRYIENYIQKYNLNIDS